MKSFGLLLIAILVAPAGMAVAQDCYDYSANPGLIGSGAVTGNVIRALETDGVHLVAGADSTLSWCDLDGSGVPVLTGTYELEETVYGVDLFGFLAFVSTNSGGLQILDFSVPDTPVVLASVPTNGNSGSRDVAYDNGHVYWADDSGGLRIIDIADPAVPVQVGEYVFPNIGTYPDAMRVEVGSGTCWVTLADASWNALDVSDPTDPQLIFTERIDPFVFSWQHLRVNGDTLHLMRSFYFDTQSWTAFAYDVSDPSQPLEIHSEFSSVDRFSAMAGDAAKTFIQAPEGLRVYEHGASPALVHTYGMSGDRRCLRVLGGLTYVGRDNTVDVYDLGGPYGDPLYDSVYLGKDGDGGTVVDDVLVCLVDDYPLPEGFDWRLIAVDISSPAGLVGDGWWSDLPPEDGPIDTPTVTGGRLYSRLYNGNLGIFDAATRVLLGTSAQPTQGTYVGNSALDWSMMLTRMDHYDFTDPTAPVGPTALDLGGAFVLDVSADDHRAYINGTAGSAALFVVDLSDPAAPSVIGSVPMPNGAFGAPLHVVDTMLWYRDATDSSLMRMFDLSGPGLPVAQGTFLLPDTIRDIAYHNGLAYLSTSNDHVVVYDLTEPTAPVFHGEYDPALSDSFSLAVHESALLLVHGGSVSSFRLDCAETGGPVAGTGDPERTPPPLFHLSVPVPNPFNPSTDLSFTLDRPEMVELAIYDVSGRRVRVLVSGQRVEGLHKVTWNGRDDRGDRMASGIYMARLKLGRTTETRKMTLLK